MGRKKQLMVLTAFVVACIFLVASILRARNPVNPIFKLENPKDPIYSIDWSLDGTRIVNSTESGAVSVWETEIGQLLVTLENLGQVAYYVGWSPDDTKVAVSSHDGITGIWDTRSWQLLMTFSETPNRVRTIGWNAGSDKLLISDFDGFIHILDIDTNQEITIPQQHFYRVLAWSSRENTLALVNTNNEIEIWNGASGQKLFSFESHTDKITTLAWNPASSSEMLATGGTDKTIKLWNTETGSSISAFDTKGAVLQIEWSSDGSRLVGLDSENNVSLWDVNTKELLVSRSIDAKMKVQDGSLTWSPNDKLIAFYRGLSTSDQYNWSGTVWILDAVSGEIVHQLEASTPFTDIAWSPDGAMLAVADSTGNLLIWRTSDLVSAQ